MFIICRITIGSHVLLAKKILFELLVFVHLFSEIGLEVQTFYAVKAGSQNICDCCAVHRLEFLASLEFQISLEFREVILTPCEVLVRLKHWELDLPILNEVEALLPRLIYRYG